MPATIYHEKWDDLFGVSASIMLVLQLNFPCNPIFRGSVTGSKQGSGQD